MRIFLGFLPQQTTKLANIWPPSIRDRMDVTYFSFYPLKVLELGSEKVLPATPCFPLQMLDIFFCINNLVYERYLRDCADVVFVLCWWSLAEKLSHNIHISLQSCCYKVSYYFYWNWWAHRRLRTLQNTAFHQQTSWYVLHAAVHKILWVG